MSPPTPPLLLFNSISNIICVCLSFSLIFFGYKNQSFNWRIQSRFLLWVCWILTLNSGVWLVWFWVLFFEGGKLGFLKFAIWEIGFGFSPFVDIESPANDCKDPPSTVIYWRITCIFNSILILCLFFLKVNSDTFAPGILFSFGFSKYLAQNELCIHFTVNLVAFAKDQPFFSQQELDICEILAAWVIVSENPLHLACICSPPLSSIW